MSKQNLVSLLVALIAGHCAGMSRAWTDDSPA